MSAPKIPPAQNGVGASSIVLPNQPWESLLDFLDAKFPSVGHAGWLSRFERGLVLDESGATLAAGAAYRNGATVHYYRELPPEPEIPFEAEILHRDEHLLIADKPHFLPVIPSGRFLQQTLLVRLKKQTGIDALAPLHRIDRGTAGVVVFSLNPATRGIYQQLFPKREVRKTYEAVAPALPRETFPQTRRTRIEEGEPFFRMRENDGEPNSETRIEVVETRGAHSLYRLQPVTGRKHQLRVHLAALGAPIVNDPLYPELRSELEDDFSKPLQLLARAIAFTDPVSGAERHFESRRRLGG